MFEERAMSTIRTRRTLLLSVFCLIPALTWGAENDPAADAGANPRWIWLGPRPGAEQDVYFRKEFTVDGPVLGTKLVASCDDSMTIYLNGERVAEGKSWETPTFAEVTERIKRGR